MTWLWPLVCWRSNSSWPLDRLLPHESNDLATAVLVEFDGIEEALHDYHRFVLRFLNGPGQG